MNINSLLNKVKIELAARSDNTFTLSGIGGNPSEFLFVLTHPLILKESTDDKVSCDVSNGNLIISVSENTPLKDIRLALKELVANHPDRVEVTQEQMQDIEFLKGLGVQSNDVTALINTIEVCQKLMNTSCTDSDVEDFDKSLSDMPHYVISFGVRTIITLKRTVQFSLDERSKVIDSLAAAY